MKHDDTIEVLATLLPEDYVQKHAFPPGWGGSFSKSKETSKEIDGLLTQLVDKQQKNGKSASAQRQSDDWLESVWNEVAGQRDPWGKWVLECARNPDELRDRVKKLKEEREAKRREREKRAAERKKREEEEAERQRLEAEARREARRKREEERKKREEEEAERQRLEALEAEARREEKRLERKKREAEQKKREEEEAERKRREKKEAEARREAKRREKEKREAQRRRQEEKDAERQRREELKAEERREAERREQEKREAEEAVREAAARREAERREREQRRAEYEERRRKQEDESKKMGWTIVLNVVIVAALLCGLWGICHGFDVPLAKTGVVWPWCWWHIKFIVGLGIVFDLILCIVAAINPGRRDSIPKDRYDDVVSPLLFKFFVALLLIIIGMFIYAVCHLFNALGFSLRAFGVGLLFAGEFVIVGFGGVLFGYVCNGLLWGHYEGD